MAWSGEITPELIGDMVKVLSKVPDYIRKLDRKRIATEKSLDARKNKIQYLEDEIKRLVTKSLHP
jgi:archaellum component FlaC